MNIYRVVSAYRDGSMSTHRNFLKERVAISHIDSELKVEGVESATIIKTEVLRESQFDSKLLNEYVTALGSELALELDQRKYTLKDICILRANAEYWLNIATMLADDYNDGPKSWVDQEFAEVGEPKVISQSLHGYEAKHGDVATTHAIAAMFGKVVHNKPMHKWGEFRQGAGVWKPMYRDNATAPKHYRFHVDNDVCAG